MNKLEKMLNEYEQAKAAKADLEKEVAQLQADKERLEKEADAAAQGGDLSLYREKRDAAQLATDTLFVRSKQMEKLNVLRTEVEAKAAWKEYADGYNKTFTKKWAEYEKSRRDLCALFLEIVDAQNEALRMRVKCAECAGIPDDWKGFSPSGYDRILPMNLIPDERDNINKAYPVYAKGPDATFFLDAKLWDLAKLNLLNEVVHWHKPV